jgi:hypothetical protein
VISNAKASGISMVFASIRKAKNRNNVPMPKKRFLNERFMADELYKFYYLINNQIQSICK